MSKVVKQAVKGSDDDFEKLSGRLNSLSSFISGVNIELVDEVTSDTNPIFPDVL